MPGFFHPLWLIALGIIPLIRWLHRWHAPLSSWSVSAIFLWEQTAADEQAGNRKDEPEPAWRRRAIAAALLVIALAGPYLPTTTRVLTVWIDDSPSAFTIENGNSRLATMLASLPAELRRSESPWTEIMLRSLTNPGRVKRYTDSGSIDVQDWQAGAKKTLDDLSMPVLTADSDHWLLTDGASLEVRTWAARASLSNIIQSGTITENSALTRLAVRRSTENAKTIDVLISVSNAGTETDVRQVSLYGGNDLLQTTRLSLPPGRTTHWQIDIAATDESLSASLSSSDSLVGDDELILLLTRFELLTTQIDPDCGPALRRALATHPSLAVGAATNEAALSVSCSRGNFSRVGRSAAHIRSLLDAAEAVSSPPVWLSHAGARDDLSLSADWISAAQWPQQESTDSRRVVLTTTAQALVVVHAAESGSSAIVDTVVDLGHPRFIEQAEYAAFIATLADLATGRTLLDEAIVVSRDARHSIVIPTSIDSSVGPSGAANQATTKPLSTLFLIAALFVLLLDAALLLRARQGAKRV